MSCGVIGAGSVPLYSVQRWLGHSTIKMTERYAHLAPEHLREGALALAGPVDQPVIFSSARMAVD